MGPEHREDIHVFLRVVKLVKSPQHSHPMISQMHQPVAAIHRHQDQDDRTPARNHPKPGKDHPGRRSSHDVVERKCESGHQGQDDDDVEDGEEDVMAMAAGYQRSPLCRAHPLHDEEQRDHRNGERTDRLGAKARQRTGEVGPAPPRRPAGPDQEAANAGTSKAGR